MIVTFCGHRQVENREQTELWLTETLEQLIAEGADTFYLGGKGAFDLLAANTLQKLKKQHPAVRSVLVLCYLNQPLHETERVLYDETLYPPLESVPPRFAMARRNLWMAEHADVLVAYVKHDWGGAANTLQHARKKGKRIVLPGECASPGR